MCLELLPGTSVYTLQGCVALLCKVTHGDGGASKWRTLLDVIGPSRQYIRLSSLAALSRSRHEPDIRVRLEEISAQLRQCCKVGASVGGGQETMLFIGERLFIQGLHVSHFTSQFCSAAVAMYFGEVATGLSRSCCNTSSSCTCSYGGLIISATVSKWVLQFTVMLYWRHPAWMYKC